MTATLYYVHDPMCSWCWGFRPSLLTLLDNLPPQIYVHRLLGGLAPDSDQPMPASMQQTLQQTWQHIQTVIPGTQFNFDFWTDNQPKRSTWSSCRAVLAARSQDAAFELPMIEAIQQAYYLNAQNPSDTEVLVALANSIGCDTARFSDDLHSDVLHKQLLSEIEFSRGLGVQGFPSLVYQSQDDSIKPIMVDYNRPALMLEQIEQMTLG